MCIRDSSTTDERPLPIIYTKDRFGINPDDRKIPVVRLEEDDNKILSPRSEVGRIYIGPLLYMDD